MKGGTITSIRRPAPTCGTRPSPSTSTKAAPVHRWRRAAPSRSALTRHTSQAPPAGRVPIKRTRSYRTGTSSRCARRTRRPPTLSPLCDHPHSTAPLARARPSSPQLARARTATRRNGKAPDAHTPVPSARPPAHIPHPTLQPNHNPTPPHPNSSIHPLTAAAHPQVEREITSLLSRAPLLHAPPLPPTPPSPPAPPPEPPWDESTAHRNHVEENAFGAGARGGSTLLVRCSAAVYGQIPHDYAFGAGAFVAAV